MKDRASQNGNPVGDTKPRQDIGQTEMIGEVLNRVGYTEQRVNIEADSSRIPQQRQGGSPTVTRLTFLLRVAWVREPGKSDKLKKKKSPKNSETDNGFGRVPIRPFTETAVFWQRTSLPVRLRTGDDHYGSYPSSRQIGAGIFLRILWSESKSSQFACYNSGFSDSASLFIITGTDRNPRFWTPLEHTPPVGMNLMVLSFMLFGTLCGYGLPALGPIRLIAIEVLNGTIILGLTFVKDLIVQPEYFSPAVLSQRTNDAVSRN
ncbi:hypothetical protein B0H14DRAFT_2646450 [Mycena olivaceomarginata]|nr:hypothetical protein B0H14DRAFT_2646450 [Mycena olivaceomarginata]